MGAELASIHQNPIRSDRDKDNLIWPHSVSGEVNANVVYERLREIVIPSTTNNDSITNLAI